MNIELENSFNGFNETEDSLMEMTMDSQILILASNMTEDFYRKIIRKKASSKELLWVSRLFVLLTALVAYAFAFTRALLKKSPIRSTNLCEPCPRFSEGRSA